MERASSSAQREGSHLWPLLWPWLPLDPGPFASGTGVFARTECENDKALCDHRQLWDGWWIGVTHHDSGVQIT